jgi:hypothetical protein
MEQKILKERGCQEKISSFDLWRGHLGHKMMRPCSPSGKQVLSGNIREPVSSPLKTTMPSALSCRGQRVMLDRDLAHSASEMIPLSRAERCHLPFRAQNDTPFPRRTVSSGISGGFGTLFPRRTVSSGIPGGFGTCFPRRRLHYETPDNNKAYIPLNFVYL